MAWPPGICRLSEAHIDKIVAAYQHRREEPRYSKQEAEIDLAATQRDLVKIEAAVREATARHNAFLKELGLPLLPH